MTTSRSIIKTTNLNIGYAGKNPKIIIENINLEISTQSLVAIIGLNGCGKSTLIKTLAKLQPAISGKILINNRNSAEYFIAEWAKKIAWVDSKTTLPTDLSVEEFIAMGRQPYTNWLDKLTQNDNEIINKVINDLELEHIRNQKGNQLSDGQAQKVAIARALAQDTDIIILDEPTSHLDIINRLKILKLLKNLVKDHQKTILFSTHEITNALEIATHIIGIGKNNWHFDTCERFIASDKLNVIFKNENLVFDKTEKRFRLI